MEKLDNVEKIIKERIGQFEINWIAKPFPHAIIDNFFPSNIFSKIVEGLGSINGFEDIKKNCKDLDFAITDISHSRAVIQIQGAQSIEALKKGSPINFNEFGVNKCVGTVFHGISIIIDAVSDNPKTFNLLTLRSFGESFYHHITDASLEFGYVGI